MFDNSLLHIQHPKLKPHQLNIERGNTNSGRLDHYCFWSRPNHVRPLTLGAV